MTGIDEKVGAAVSAAAPPVPLAVEPIAPARSGARRYAVGVLTLVERPGGRWAVRDLTGRTAVGYLATDGTWSTYGGAGPEWEATYWHDLGIAARLARDAQQCPACHAGYGPPELDGSWLASVCYPPTVDYPIPGCEMPIPAWCAARQAFVWRNADGALESDRPCVGCGNTGRIPVGSLEDGTPLSWRSCPRCCPTPAEIQAHEKAVAAYGEDYF